MCDNGDRWDYYNIVVPTHDADAFYTTILQWFRNAMHRHDEQYNQMTWSNLVVHNIESRYRLVLVAGTEVKRKTWGENACVTRDFAHLGRFYGPAVLFRTTGPFYSQPATTVGMPSWLVSELGRLDAERRKSFGNGNSLW